jgi:hypothetical protein
MRQLLVIAASLGLALAAAAQGQTPARFRFAKPIELPAAKDEEIVAFRIDSDVYAVTKPGLPDLRVFDKDQAEVPYLIEAEVELREERSRVAFATEIVTARPDGNTLEVTLRLPDKSPNAEGFTIATPLVNYERKVRVAGSADGVKWTPLLADALLFDYTRFMDVSRREIPLPANTFRQFKLTIEDVIEEAESPFKELTRTFRADKEDQKVERTMIERRPFRIDRIGAWSTATRERIEQTRQVAYPVAEFAVKEESAKKQSVISVKTRREPISRFTLKTTSRNFSRRAVVEVLTARAKGPAEWRPIGEATISNVNYRDQRQEQLTITFPETREEQYRIVIHNDDNPVLSLQGVNAEGGAQHVVFMAQPGGGYRVAYGSDAAEAPRYEAATVLAKLRRATPPVAATLGAQVANPDFAAAPATVQSVLNNRVFLGTAIVVMVAVLGWALYRASRRMEDLPKE